LLLSFELSGNRVLGRPTRPIVARVVADGMLARTASTAAIVASVAGEGMWAGTASAASSSLQALIIFPNGLAAASTPGDQACAASSASAADAAPTNRQAAILTSSTRALIAVPATTGSDPRSIKMDRIQNLSS
jgi:hypothetical protein